MTPDKLVIGQNILLLRYSTSLCETIIEEHISMIKNNGYVWYGKLSGVTSNKILDAVLSAEHPALILYQKGAAFLCELEDFTTNKPAGGYPKYYEEEFIFPSCYFKLKSIEKLDMKVFDDIYVRSSKRNLTEVFSKQCMSSSLFVSYKEIKEIDYANLKKHIDNMIKQLDKDDCVYKVNSKCCNKNFINCGYDCNNANSCKKQKR